MLPLDVDAATRWTAERLLAGSLQGAVAIGLVWLACRRLPRIPASVQAALWWLAAMKLVLTLLPVPALSIPLLPAGMVPAHDAAARDSSEPNASSAAGAPAARSPGAEMAATPAPASVNAWLAAAVGLWLVVLVIQAVRLIVTYRTLQGVVRRSVPRAGEEDTAVVAQLAAIVGLARIPEVRASEEIAAPQVVGLRRPIVLVPAGAALSSDEWTMALCHELMHVRRHDLAFGWGPALAERLFFFHPLARLAAREYVTAREAACDAAVVRALGVSPDDYGRLIVRLGVSGAGAAFAAGGSSPSMSSLRRRLDMLQYANSIGASRRLTLGLAAAMVLVLMPLQLGARVPPAQVAAAGAAIAEGPGARVEVPVMPQAAAPAPQPLVAVQAAPPAAVPVSAGARQDAPSTPSESVEVAGDPTPEPQPATAEPRQEGIDAERRVRQALEALARTRANAEEAQRLRMRTQVEALLRQRDEQARESGLGEQAAESQRPVEELAEQIRTVRRRLEQAEQQLVPPAPEQALAQQLERLARQQERLSQQLQAITKLQEALAEAQRRFAAEAEQIREAMKER
jgi:beta-lactamase regulating signal transducer with metallopeptidase domain